MSDDLRLPTDEERARIHAARILGGLCAACGRPLAEDDPIWIERIIVGRRDAKSGLTYWRVSLGRECAATATLRATESRAPERCRACGRGVYYDAAYGHRRLAFCSRRCSRRHHNLGPGREIRHD